MIMNSQTTNIPMNSLTQSEEEKSDDDRQAYYGAFNSFDWNSSGKISHGSLLSAMRRAGANPTEVEVHDIINKLDDGSGHITFSDFCTVMMEKNEEMDQEINYKETFRVFSKDTLGCISADEFKFVFKHLGVKQTEIEEMLSIMDRNGDGKVSYSEFRVMMGALPLVKRK